MQVEHLIEKIRERVWFAGSEQAVRAVHATLEVLGERLHPIDAAIVRERLPAELARHLRPRGGMADFGRAELFERVRAREGMRLSISAEHVVVICQALAELVDESARRHLTLRLPEELAALFEVPTGRQPGVGAELRHYGRRPAGEVHTLASGRQAFGTHSQNAHGQEGSVVEATNPHADSKLSSARVEH